MKNVILKIGGLVVIGMLCTLVPVSLYAGCGDGSLDGSVKITPSTLNLSNPSQSPVIMAHISGDNLNALLASHNSGNPFQITCINSIPLAAPIAPIPGMASIDDDVLNIGFYRYNLISALAVASSSVKITVAQNGISAGGGAISFTLGNATPIFTGDISGFTSLNLGLASEPVSVTFAIAEASASATTSPCFLGGAFDLSSIPLDTSLCSIGLTNATLLVTVNGSGSTVTFSGITLTGPGSTTTIGGVTVKSGSDDIKLK